MGGVRQEKAAMGARLREARLSAGVTREEAALASGAQVSAVDAWERGSSLPTLPQFRDLLACYGALAHRLLFGSLPIDMTSEEAKELSGAAKEFSPALRRKVDVLICLLAKAGAEVTH